MLRPHRRQSLWIAYFLHRVSGVALALFLPVHFYVLGLALRDADRLDTFLTWTENPLVKMAEVMLVFCLGIHLFGGLRLLALEFLPWSPRQKTLASLAVVTALAVSVCFLLATP